MHAELLYTSAPQGLKQGSRGFCTVLCTQGMPANLTQRLEALSMYRHVFAPGDPNASRNPVCFAHLRFMLGQKQTNLLTRISDYGLDYSQRTNKLAHHIVVAAPLPDCGPAALLAHPGMMKKSWDGKCDSPAMGPRLPYLQSDPKPCRTWASVTGDEGWGGVIANAWLKPGSKTLWLVFSELQSAQLLEMFEESISLLPPTSRWQATFSTYFTNLPPDVQCQVRCVLAGSEEAKHAKARGDVIDLTRSLGQAPPGLGVEEARNGISIGTREASASPALSFPKHPGSSASADVLDKGQGSSRHRRSQAGQANCSSATAPPVRPGVGEAIPPITGKGRLDNRTPPATTDPNRGVSKRSRSLSVGVLLAAGLLLLILLPMLGAGAVLIAFNLLPNTANQNHDSERVEAIASELTPANANETPMPAIDPAVAQPPESQPSPPGPDPTPEARPITPPAITADNFRIDVKYSHPALGDLGDRKWLVDGTELTIEIIPKGSNDLQRKQEELWLEGHPPSISLQLNGKSKDVVSRRCSFEYADIEDILKSDAVAANKSSNILATLEGTVEIGERKDPIKHELHVPYLRANLQKKYILPLLEPEFFRGRSDEHDLYNIDESAGWIGKLKEMQPKKQWYAFKDTNCLDRQMRFFDHDESQERATLRRLLFSEYASGLARGIKEFQRKVRFGSLFEDILQKINAKFISNSGEYESGFEAIKRLDGLLEEQARVAAIPQQNQDWGKARELASGLQQILGSDQWESYYPTDDKTKVRVVNSMIYEWNRGSELKENWKQVMKHAEAVKDLLPKTKREIYGLSIQEFNSKDTFKLPVIVEYQP